MNQKAINNLRIFNTLNRSLERMEPRVHGGMNLSLYTCGPTVYDYAHIGNFRAYVFEDLLHRHLQYRDFIVHRVMNLTDIDDKTILGAKKSGLSLNDYTRPFKEAFFRDAKVLRLLPAKDYPEATDPKHLKKMIEMITILMQRGHAYRSEDGSVYFRISSFPNYGQLAHVDFEAQRQGSQVLMEANSKERVVDFALWKAWVPEDAEVGWMAPWGKGRPGWHIECSAMATGLLGETIDIHCGGIDNIFPHHEAEIAQCECAGSGDLPFVRYWMHCAHLMIDGSKMAKSSRNFFTLADLLSQGWTGREIRYVLLSVHYRTPLNFTIAGLRAARIALARLDSWEKRLREIVEEEKDDFSLEVFEMPIQGAENFFLHLDDDLNISAALAVLFETIRQGNWMMNQKMIHSNQARLILEWLRRVNSILALEPETKDVTMPSEIRKLLEDRDEARSVKDWKTSDKIRDQIADLGWLINDTKDGQKISRA